MREIADLEYIVVDNEREALALENNLIKRHKPKFNVLLRDDKTYPYIRYTAFEKYPRVYVTRRLKKDGSIYFGPYFPASLAYRLVHLIHKHFLVPSCTVDLTRSHPRPCLQYYIHRCLGPCAGSGHGRALRRSRARRTTIPRRAAQRSVAQPEAAHGAGFRSSSATRRPPATATCCAPSPKWKSARKSPPPQGDDTDVLAWYAEPPQVAVNLFHLRGGRVVDRRDFYWEDLEEFDPGEFLPSLLKQLYLDAAYLPRSIHVPMDFEDCALLEEVLTEAAGHRVEIAASAARPETRVPGTGGEKRQAIVRAALSRAEAQLRRQSPRRSNPRWHCPNRPSASSASTFRTFKGRTRWRPWWCGKTGA